MANCITWPDLLWLDLVIELLRAMARVCRLSYMTVKAIQLSTVAEHSLSLFRLEDTDLEKSYRDRSRQEIKKRVFVEISSAFILIVAPAPAIVAESVISADLQFTNGIQRNSEFGCVRLIPAELYLWINFWFIKKYVDSPRPHSCIALMVCAMASG